MSSITCMHAFPAVLAQQECRQLALVSGCSRHIPSNSRHLLTVHTAHYLSVLSAYRRRQSLTPRQEKKPTIHNPSVKPVADVEMDSNVAHGTANEDIITYCTVN